MQTQCGPIARNEGAARGRWGAGTSRQTETAKESGVRGEWDIVCAPYTAIGIQLWRSMTCVMPAQADR